MIDAKYHKYHLEHMLNLDYSNPNPKMMRKAKESGIDLTDPLVIEEFKRL